MYISVVMQTTIRSSRALVKDGVASATLSGCCAAGSKAFTQTRSRHVARTPNLHKHLAVASSQFHGAPGFDGRRRRARARKRDHSENTTHLYRSAYTYYKSASDTQPNLNFTRA